MRFLWCETEKLSGKRKEFVLALKTLLQYLPQKKPQVAQPPEAFV